MINPSLAKPEQQQRLTTSFSQKIEKDSFVDNLLVLYCKWTLQQLF